MYLAPTLLGSLLLLNGATACRKSEKPQGKFKKRTGRVCQDKLYQCFAQSPPLSQEYCTSSLGLPSTTLTVTVTPAPILTTQEEMVTVTSTVQPPDRVAFKRDGAIERRIATSSASQQQLGCAPESTIRIWPASRWTSTTTAEPATVPTVVTITTTSVTTPLTTITSCPPFPTYNGQPALCYTPSNLPSFCQQLKTSAINSRSLSQSAVYCSQSLTQYGMTLAPDARACFPTSWPANPAATAASSTRSAIYSCLIEPQKSVLCQYDVECDTATFPVDQVPTTPFPAPNPAVGDDILNSTGTFGSYGTSLDALYDWAVSGTGWPNHLSLALSDARSHSGRRSLVIRYLNTRGGGVDLKAFQGKDIPVVPGRRYEFKVWFQHTISAQTNGIYLYGYPAGLILNEVLGPNKPDNQWRQASISFIATTSWVQLVFNFGGNVGGGVCDLYLDDVTFKRSD
ncbi:hypothetical protein B0H66DRAFT_630526 [Apodospora peruviana]|uniref:CBM-cenC domain-containing protein n=1 Tax=Apodospora peruviana TaxID=516989 RepID=A0AAE0HWB7_9PEZI|nr:hypothetical protein B0H66DRAFT_630526 [Apodospora peruviana]